MESTIIANIQPILFTALVGVIIAYARYVNSLKTRVALQASLKSTTDNIQKSIEHIHTRQDSHSKKQDAVMELLTDFKMEMLKEVGNMSSNVSVLTADVKNLSNLISITDVGIKVDTNNRKKKK